MVKLGNRENANSFERLYFEYYTDLCKHIFRFTQDEDITKDIVQDVFIKYWQQNKEKVIFGSPSSYLRKACVNQALNYIKERDRRENREQVFAIEKKDSSTPGRPDDKMESEELADTIQSTIYNLPTMCKTVFLLSRYEEKSYKEIAAKLDISINTVEKHIGKALQKLRDKIKKR